MYNHERNQLLDNFTTGRQCDDDDDDVKMITSNATKTTANYPFLGLAMSFRA
jgi:hypothetical protein